MTELKQHIENRASAPGCDLDLVPCDQCRTLRGQEVRGVGCKWAGRHIMPGGVT